MEGIEWDIQVVQKPSFKDIEQEPVADYLEIPTSKGQSQYSPDPKMADRIAL